MKPIGKLLYRSIVVISIVTLAATMPASPAVAAFAAFTNDDFNRCEMLGVWQDETGSHANPTIVGAGNNSEASLSLVVAPGEQSTMSTNTLNASRVMQSATDESFELEVRFNSGLQPTGSSDSYRMQGILVRDDNGGNPKWLRFDLNQNNSTLGYYISYINESGSATGLTPGSGNVAIISQNPAKFNQVGTAIRVRYTQATGEWAFSYYLPGDGWSTYYAITESAPPRGTPFTFNVTDIGVWVGSTDASDEGPGNTALFDYFWTVPVPSSEDDIMDCGDITYDYATFLPVIHR